MAPEIVEEPTVKEGKVIYEQDIRAAAHSNGRTPHILESKVGGGNSAPPTDGGEDHDHLPDRPPAVKLALGLVYLAAGSFLIYAGVIVLRDWKKEKAE
jgi:hypothetical protein